MYVEFLPVMVLVIKCSCLIFKNILLKVYVCVCPNCLHKVFSLAAESKYAFLHYNHVKKNSAWCAVMILDNANYKTTKLDIILLEENDI